jgi:CCR4-NOT transcription complex subunit 9
MSFALGANQPALGPNSYEQQPHSESIRGASEQEQIYGLILQLTNPAEREQSLLELSKKRESYEDLAPILWHSFGFWLAHS